MRITILLGIAAISLGLVAAKPITDKDPVKGIEFFDGTWEEAVALSEKEGKPIFLDAYASWCGPCKMLKSRVFTNEEVGSYYNDNFINMKMDMEKGEGKALARKYRVTAYPSLFFINADGSVRKKAVGYHNPDQIIQLGKTALAANGA
ncbi:thioredoxin family protein [Salibacteraceae bacterium]|nr:thioredoxin family protein [Salibacteraceae bacterium]